MYRNVRNFLGALLIAAVTGCAAADVDKALNKYRDCQGNSDLAERIDADPRALRNSLRGENGKISFETANQRNQKALDDCNVAVHLLDEARPDVFTEQDKSLTGTLLGTYAITLYLRSDLQSIVNGPPSGENGEPDWKQVYDRDQILSAVKAAKDAQASGSAFIGGNLLMSVKTLEGYLDFTKVRQGMRQYRTQGGKFPETEGRQFLCSADEHIREALQDPADDAAKIRHAVNRARMFAVGYQEWRDDADAAQYRQTAKTLACKAVFAVVQALADSGNLNFNKDIWRQVQGTRSWSDLSDVISAMGLTAGTELKSCAPTNPKVRTSWKPDWTKAPDICK